MNWISALERRFGSWAIPNLGLYIILIQVIGVVLLLGERAQQLDLLLIGDAVLKQGDWWRLVSFMMLPPSLSFIWLLIGFYVFYLMSNALERHWGTFRFNLFILVGYLLTVAMAFLKPSVYVTNTYFLGCVFLAFATLFPKFEFLLFFILPVKVKWLGWLTAASYCYVLFTGYAGSRLCVIAAFLTYFLFFGNDIVRNILAGQRRKEFQAQTATAVTQTRHTCAVCGITEKSDPAIHFRYCSTCGKCFCEEHIEHHTH